MKKYLLLGMVISMSSYVVYSVSQQEAKKEVANQAPVVSQKEIIDLINKIIKENASFAVKLSHPLLPGKVRLWQQRGLVQFPTKQSWSTFIKDVNQFGTYLHTLLERNPQSGEYYHLEKAQKDATLYKNLQKLDQVLSANEPKIERTPSPLKLSKESLEALQKIINTYGTTLYQEKLLEQLDQLLKGFEQEAKKIRTEEEKATAQAGRTQRVAPQEFSFEDLELGSDFDFTSAPEPDIDFTTPSYDTDSEDFSFDLDSSDDFLKSFFD
jgi:hypothetical protein